MNTTTAAEVLLKLYELRTEPTLRQARAWFAFEFHPTSARDVLSTWLGPGHESAPYRMVTSYWDMAASLVTLGAIPSDMFNAANTEHFAVYAKMRPYLTEVRAATNYPDYLMNVDTVGSDFRLYPIPNCGKGQPMQTKKLGNGGPTMRTRARVIGG